MEWQPIHTAPRDGTPVKLRCARRPEFGVHFLGWNAKRRRWEGYVFAVAGRRKVWWDPAAIPPTEWQHA
jgi:hypothetical protein